MVVLRIRAPEPLVAPLPSLVVNPGREGVPGIRGFSGVPPDARLPDHRRVENASQRLTLGARPARVGQNIPTCRTAIDPVPTDP